MGKNCVESILLYDTITISNMFPPREREEEGFHKLILQKPTNGNGWNKREQRQTEIIV